MTPLAGFLRTEQNHFQHGFVKGHPTVFFSKISIGDRPALSGLEESIVAARKVFADAKGLPLQLCISGGIDSEVMMDSFLKAGVPFETTILKFSNELNDFDISNAIQYSRSHGIEPRIIELDVLSFFDRGEHLGYAEKYRCQSPQLAVHLWMLDQMDGFPVMSGNFIFPQKTGDEIFYVGLPGDLHCTYFRYFDIQNKPGVPWFLIYTPQQVRAFLETPAAVRQHSKNVAEHRSFTYDIKCEIYREAGFSALPRADKFTGFEKVRLLFDQKYGTQHGVKFDELYRKPLLELNPIPEEYLQIVDGV